jgi:biopolymer transport protein ExbD
MAIKRRNKVDATFNMSSMTDIVFLLLVFFIIASTLITPNALNIILPQASPHRIENQPATVEITKDGMYALDGNIINIGNLEGELKVALSNKESKGIVLKADQDVALNYVVKVMDIANRNNFKMVLATKGK